MNFYFILLFSFWLAASSTTTTTTTTGRERGYSLDSLEYSADDNDSLTYENHTLEPSSPSTIVDEEIFSIIRQGSVRQLKSLIESYNTAKFSLCFNCREDGTGETPSTLAALLGELDILKVILKSCPSAHQQHNSNGQTALQLAILSNHKNVIEFLSQLPVFTSLSPHPQLQLQSPQSLPPTPSSPLGVAFLEKDHDVNNDKENVEEKKEYNDETVSMTTIPLCHEEEINSFSLSSTKSRILFAIVADDVEEFLFITENNDFNMDEQVNFECSNGLFVVHYAATNGATRIMPHLLTVDSINQITLQGATPLMLAVINQHTEMVRLLINEGADMLAEDFNNESAFSMAFASDFSEEIQRIFLDSFNRKSSEKEAAASMSSSVGNPRLFQPVLPEAPLFIFDDLSQPSSFSFPSSLPLPSTSSALPFPSSAIQQQPELQQQASLFENFNCFDCFDDIEAAFYNRKVSEEQPTHVSKSYATDDLFQPIIDYVHGGASDFKEEQSLPLSIIPSSHSFFPSSANASITRKKRSRKSFSDDDYDADADDADADDYYYDDGSKEDHEDEEEEQKDKDKKDNFRLNRTRHHRNSKHKRIAVSDGSDEECSEKEGILEDLPINTTSSISSLSSKSWQSMSSSSSSSLSALSLSSSAIGLPLPLLEMREDNFIPETEDKQDSLMVSYLLEVKNTPTDVRFDIFSDDKEQLLKAIKENAPNVLDLIKRVGPLSVLPNFDWSILHCCAWYGRKELIEYLVKNESVPINLRSESNKATALILASNSTPSLVPFLITELGADAGLCNAFGYTALHFAASRGNVENVRLLLLHGASPFVKCSIGESSLDLARKNGHQEIVGIFESMIC